MPDAVTFEDDDRLPDYEFGITNIVARPTPGIDSLRPEEFAAGRLILRRKTLRYRPRVVAMVGITVYRAMFPERRGTVALGEQADRIGESAVFVLPNPSGRNANYSYNEMLGAFKALKTYTAAAGASSVRQHRRR